MNLDFGQLPTIFYKNTLRNSIFWHLFLDQKISLESIFYNNDLWPMVPSESEIFGWCTIRLFHGHNNTIYANFQHKNLGKGFLGRVQVDLEHEHHRCTLKNDSNTSSLLYLYKGISVSNFTTKFKRLRINIFFNNVLFNFRQKIEVGVNKYK